MPVTAFISAAVIVLLLLPRPSVAQERAGKLAGDTDKAAAAQSAKELEHRRKQRAVLLLRDTRRLDDKRVPFLLPLWRDWPIEMKGISLSFDLALPRLLDADSDLTVESVLKNCGRAISLAVVNLRGKSDASGSRNENRSNTASGTLARPQRNQRAFARLRL